ncbi:Protein of unknown function [Flavobacterium indicum GPTSA100-9 = DSM 17447]|uniref:Uncharacterized protein n=1 Tax=Flavobacterium indicum (strain DSM 17447 / CIP 109464 / GPTSA100-9) TaxID=1094466 RepID=H8XU34_FLAIG|nr:DUF6428 family protein [Flavobacterium indicum]CCG52817.1 Protein of unknown function [Flavobacterium indicum GPTSA100-9 = DSM 17447]
MLLSELIYQLQDLKELNFVLPDGSLVPSHFHITEMGFIAKKYTDCGNTFREENYFTFQLWYAGDVEHRLTSEKFLKIITSIIEKQGGEDAEVLVEYQMETTIGKFKLDFFAGNFALIGTQTTCLASDHCGIPEEKMKVSLKELQAKTSCCTPNSGCC